MTTNTSTHITTEPAAPGLSIPPHDGKPKKRGLIWVLVLLIIAGVAGYAVWRAGQPGLVATPQGGGGGRGGGRGRGNFGPTPVSVTKPHKANVPVYLNGLGNVTAFYTVTVRSRVDGQLMSIAY